MRAGAVTVSEAGLLASAVALRWSRPDLTAALAEHVGEVSAGDGRTWVVAAGWLVNGRAAVGDGRPAASDLLAELTRRGPALLDDPAADRLRIEVAVLAAGQCEPVVARRLVAPLLEADRSAEVRADALGVLARCVMEERPAAVDESTRRAEAAWGEVGGRDAEIAVAALALLSAAALRRSGHPESAVDRAAEGLARLEGIRGAQEGLPPRRLVAALGAEWITALVEAGRMDDAREGCLPMARQLQETTRPTRQVALLRLAMARALAESTSVGAVEALEQAARDAAACDAPDLEGLCLSTLGALREQSGRLDAALESMRRGVAAQRRDRVRSERFRAALSAMALGSHPARVEAVVLPDRPEVAVAPVRARPQQQRPRAASNVTPADVDPVHPLAGGGEFDPWSTGTWANQPGFGATAVSGRRRRAGRTRMEPENRTAGFSASDVEEQAGSPLPGPAAVDTAAPAAIDPPADAAATEHGMPTASALDSPAAPARARPTAPALDWPAALNRDRPTGPGSDQSTTLDRGRSDPPKRDGPAGSNRSRSFMRDRDRPGAPVADPAAGDGGVGDVPAVPQERPAYSAYDGERWLQAALAELERVWGQPLPDLERHVDPPAEPAVKHPAPKGQAGDAVGCVVVIDVVRAGAPVLDGGEVLREVGDRLNQRIPGGGRLRFEADGSALSVVLPGRERSAATHWMYEALPALFADMTGLAAPAPWDTGTTLRATVHDTDGPFGAQLLQRLDVVARASPLSDAHDDVASAAVVRWGVPIHAGSGGRRRRPEKGADGARSGIERTTAEQAVSEPPDAEPADSNEVANDQGPAFSYWDGWAAPRQKVQRPAEPTAETSGRHREPRPAAAAGRSPGGPSVAGQVTGDAAAAPANLRADQTDPAHQEPAHRDVARQDAARQDPAHQDPAQKAPLPTPTADDSTFSVDGLGLADLLAGALAAYRGI
ncbi:MAG TPA: hypothetical protein VGE11_26385 [Pseudonocardia sp.]